MSRRGRPVSLQNNSKKSNSHKSQQIYFLLIAAHTIGVEVPYKLMNNDIRNILRRFDAQWSHSDKLWLLKEDIYLPCFQAFLELLKNKQESQIALHKVIDFAFKSETQIQQVLEVKNSSYNVIKTIKYSQIQTSIDPADLPFYHKLYDFQKESLSFGIKKHGRLLLADEMGVGKTLQSLAIAYIYKFEWPLLIICPSALRLNWQQEIMNWMADLVKKSQIQVYSKGGVAIRETTRILIVSYDLAWKIKDQIDEFNVVIADEAHYLKNSGNKRSDVLVPFLSSRKRVILLTGTPAFAKPRQIYNLASIVRPDVFYYFKEFAYRYCEPKQNPWSRAMEYNGCKNSKELYYLLKDKVMIRRLKKDVLTELPEKQRQKIIIETDKAITKEIKYLLNKNHQNKNLESMVIQMLNFGYSSDHSSNQDERETIMEAYRLTGKAKLQSSKEYVLSLLENNVKILIFAHHQVILDGLQDAIEKKSYKFIRVDGQISKQARHQRVKNFQEDQSIMAALLSITAAGVGLTLTAASTVIFAEMHWTPGMMIQAEDRAHRIGQKNCVNCHYLIGENSLDDILYSYLEKKVKHVSSFVDGQEAELKIQSLQKGQMGKVSKKSPLKLKEPRQSLLFQHVSNKKRKPIELTHVPSQQTEISSENSDIENTQSVKKSKKRQPFEIEEQKLILETSMDEIEHVDNGALERKSSGLEERKSSDLCEFIANNAKELLTVSQPSSQSDCEEPRDDV